MAKTKISEYDSTAANNTDVDGINIAESCPPSGINNAIREVMAHLKDFQTGTSGDPFTNSSTVTSSGTLAVTGNLTFDGASGTSGQVLVSAGSGATPTWGNAFVAGMIMMWSGTIATIPSGWYLCDGTNSTPDLRNKFIIAADADDGGVAKTTVTGSATQSGGSKDAIVVSHTHTGSTSSVGDHQHEVFGFWHWVDESIEIMATRLKSTDQSASGRDDDQTSGAAGAHSHTMSLDSAGSSGTNANLPPYYALAFIMKS